MQTISMNSTNDFKLILKEVVLVEAKQCFEGPTKQNTFIHFPHNAQLKTVSMNFATNL